MKKSERKIKTYQAEEIGMEGWLKIKKELNLKPATLYSIMGPQWCNLWILKWKDGRVKHFRQL